MSHSLCDSLVRILRRWSLPLGCYYVITLAVPIANGAARQGVVFVTHALTVLVFPPLLIALVCAFGAFAELCRRLSDRTLSR